MTTRATGYPYFGVPPARSPRPAAAEPTLMGKRLILSTPEGFLEDMRAVSERYVDNENRDVVDVGTEEAYYAWMLTGEPPSSEPWPSHLVWVQG
jgi:hypothetical protein